MGPWRATLLLVLLVGCGEKNQPAPINNPLIFQPRPEATEKLDTEQTLRLNLLRAPRYLNPLLVRDATAQCIPGLIYEAPFGIDAKMEFKVNPNMVQELARSPDHLTYTVTMKPGLRWHDGQPLTPADVVFSFQLRRDLPNQPVTMGLQAIDRVEQTGPLTWQMVFKHASPTHQWELLFPILPRHLWAEVLALDPTLCTSPAAAELEKRQIGNGPYKLTSCRKTEEMVLTRWADYPGPKPAFRQVIWSVLTDPNAAILAFQAGDLDVLRFPNARYFQTARENPAIRKRANLARGDIWTYQFVVWNISGANPFFLDPRVRRAMAHSLDRKTECARLGFSPCAGPFHPDSWAADPQVKQLAYDPNTANRLLDAAGWPRDAKGWRQGKPRFTSQENRRVWTLDREGERVKEPLPFAFTLLTKAGSPATLNLARRWRESLKKVGIKLTITSLEPSSWYQRTRLHDFTASVFAWLPGEDPSTTADVFGTDGWPERKNFGGYSNKEVDRLYAAGIREMDPKARQTIYQRIHRLLHRDQPYMFLWYIPEALALRSDLRGIEFGPRGAFNFFPGISGWWIPAAKED